MAEGKKFLLEVPVDASQIADLTPDQAVKVVAYSKKGSVGERVVRLGAGGKGTASFQFSASPGSLQIAIGPETASAADLKNLQTLTTSVPASSWRTSAEVKLAPVIISSYYWRWWLFWCRRFRVTGRLLCSNGAPVVGATVTAIDVEAWWWWISEEPVGTAVTDSTGSFEIDFTRCCGWWPWYWWSLHHWRVDPLLVDRISGVLAQRPQLKPLAAAVPAPSLDVFQSLLQSNQKITRTGLIANVSQPAAGLSDAAIDPEALTALRRYLNEVLPKEFPLPIWPWYDWFPWLDCGANLIFKATQVCGGQTNTIVAETIFDTRWDVATHLNVTLHTGDLACCAYTCGNDCPEGNCLVPSDICDINVGSVGGNVGAPPSTPGQIGLYAPGTQDRPFAGNVSLFGLFGDAVNVDYYEFLYATSPGGPYEPLPLSAVGGIDRQTFVTVPTPKWLPVAFPVNTLSDGVSTHNVIETIAHYEANNGPHIWDAATHDELVVLQTLNTLPNGTYYLKLAGYVRPGYAGNLALADTGNPGDPGVLPVCGLNAVSNWWVVTIDNRAPGNTDPSSTPNGGDQPCGLHTCTNQPASDILRITILHEDNSSTIVEPCFPYTINCTDKLQVDFVAYDPDGFLDSYSLYTLYGLDQSVDLLGIAGGVLAPSPIAPAWAPAAAQSGPTYAGALSQGATSPVWSGGALRLTVAANAAFPETCAYQIQLNVSKRTIFNCLPPGDDYYGNVTFESFVIQNDCGK